MVQAYADFYKGLFEIDNNSDDDVHQFIISDETTLTVYNDGKYRKSNFQNICLEFTVDDIDLGFERLKKLGIQIIDPPTVKTVGCKNHDI